MKGLKYIIFSFVICFMALNTVLAEVCEYTYSEGANNYSFKCTVNNNTFSCNFVGLSSVYKKVDSNNNLVNASSTEVIKLKKSDFLDSAGKVNCNNVKSIKVDFNVDNSMNWEVYNVGNNISCTVANSVYNQNKGNYLYTRCYTFNLKGASSTVTSEETGTGVGTSNNNFNTDNFCVGAVQGVFTTIGWVFFFLKILVPIALIVFGSIDFGKAVIASKDDEIKKSAKALIMRVIAGVIIFFVPTILSFVVSIFDKDNIYNGTFTNCTQCMLDPKHVFNDGSVCSSLGGN